MSSNRTQMEQQEKGLDLSLLNEELRRAIAEHLYRFRGIRAAPEQIRQIHRGILDFVRQFLEAERQLGFQLPIRGRDAYAPMRSVCSPKNKRFIRELEGLLDEIQIGVPR